MADIGLQFNLRVVLLSLGLLFVLAILLDGLRRKYRRKRRLFAQESTQEFAYDDDLSDVPAVAHSAPPSVDREAAQTESNALTLTAMSQHILVVYLQAKAERPYVGYELLQAILSCGLRYGKMNIFHRYQTLNGTGPVLFSLASAKEPGSFDIRQMGGVSCHALCLFTRLSHDKQADIRHFDLMLETGNQLMEDLGGVLLDDNGQAFTVNTYTTYRRHIDALHHATPVEYTANA